jgi:hypothetical protein
MKLRYDPFPLIFNTGDEVTKLACLELFGFKGIAWTKDYLQALVNKQRPDGSFPSEFNPEKWGMRETVRYAIILSRFGLPGEGVNVGRAVEFILDHQGPEGGWVENSYLDLHPVIMELSTEQAVTWLTADVVDLLCLMGRGGSAPRHRALTWLRGVQNSQGGWGCFKGAIGGQQSSSGDPDSTAQITFLMKEMYGEDDPIYQRGKKLFEGFLEQYAQDVERGYWIRTRDGKKEPLDAYHLTHLFLSWLFDLPRRFESGYDVADARVERVMEALMGIQQKDGGWRPFWAEGSSPSYTMLAVKVLVLSGMLKKEVLRDDVEESI